MPRGLILLLFELPMIVLLFVASLVLPSRSLRKQLEGEAFATELRPGEGESTFRAGASIRVFCHPNRVWDQTLAAAKLAFALGSAPFTMSLGILAVGLAYHGYPMEAFIPVLALGGVGTFAAMPRTGWLRGCLSRSYRAELRLGGELDG